MKRRLSLAALLMNAIILVATVANAGQLFLGMSLAVDPAEYLVSGPAVVTPPPAPFDDKLRATRQLVLTDLDEIAIQQQATQQLTSAALLHNFPDVPPLGLQSHPRRTTFLFGSIDLTHPNAKRAGDELVEGLFERNLEAERRTDMYLSFNASYEFMERSEMKAWDDFHFGVSYHF